MVRYHLPEPCRLGVDAGDALNKALAEQLAGPALLRDGFTDPRWPELTARLTRQTSNAPIPIDPKVYPESFLELMLDICLLVPPLAQSGLVGPDRCAVMAECLLDSVRRAMVADDNPAWLAFDSERSGRWQPGQPRLSHPAFRPRHWWCVAEMLRRCLLTDVLPRLHHEPHAETRGEGEDTFTHISMLRVLDVQVRPRSREIRVALPPPVSDPDRNASTLSISHPLPRWYWLNQVVEDRCGQLIRTVALAACRQSRPTDTDDAVVAATAALRSWLRAGLKRAVVRSGQLPAMRRRLLRAYAVQPALAALAWQCRPTGQLHMSGADYQYAWRNGEALARLRNEDPTLFPVYAALVCDLQLAPADGYAALKDGLRSRGLSRGAWSRLVAHGRPVVRLLRASCAQGTRLVDVLVPTMNLIVATQRPGLPPLPVLRALAAAKLHRLVDTRLRVPIGMLRAAWDAVAERPGSASAVVHEFDSLLGHWKLARWTPGHLPAALRWRWFQRQLLSVEAGLAVAPWLDACWPAPLASFASGDHVAVALTDGRSVYAEALAMRHCLGLPHFLNECQAGRCLPFSLRDAATGRRRYTALLTRDRNDWTLAQIAGFANAPAPAWARRFARRLLEAHRGAANEVKHA